MQLAIALLSAWALGGIPFGLLIVRWCKGVDIREVGSGNVGATNASRAFEGATKRFVFVGIYLLDFFKGLIPALWFAGWFGLPDSIGHAVLLGAAAVIGHCASPFLRLKGGKGVATTTGLFAAIEPIALVASLVIFGVVTKLSGRVFWGSLALGLTLALVVPLREPGSAFAQRWPATVCALLVSVFLVYTHRSNLRLAFSSDRGCAA